jgi:ABC-type transport system involved in multi-copper enzyme maturation permease subunit
MNTILVIAKNTIKETIRDKILLSALFVIVGIILFTLFIGSISLDQSTRIIVNFSLTAIYALQVFVAIFIGSMLMYKEIERKTFYLILPKPVHRGSILIGKCLGLTITTLLVTLISTSVLILILMLEGATLYIAPMLLSIFLSTLEAVILILISMFFSTLTSPIIAAVGTIAFFLIGHAGDILRKLFMLTDSSLVEFVLRAAYYTLPNLEKFNIRNDVTYGTVPSLGIILAATLYACVYAAFLLFITNIVFKKKDF